MRPKKSTIASLVYIWILNGGLTEFWKGKLLGGYIDYMEIEYGEQIRKLLNFWKWKT